MTNAERSEIRDNGEHESIWLRGLFMLLFVLIYWAAEVVVVAVAIVQFVWVVTTDERNARLELFAASLSAFVYAVIRYWTFVSEQKPFPFSDWPSARSASEEIR